MNTRREVLAALAATLAAPSWARDWPAQPVRLVVPYPPGGANDIVARIYGQSLQGALGQPMVIDNRAGAGGEIGAEHVANSPTDGYTLLFGAIGSLAIHAVIPAQKPSYDLAKAFMGVSMGAAVPLALAVRGDMGVQDVQGLIKLARESKRGLSYGSAGNGSTQHMTTEYFRQRADIGLVHVPYKGSAAAINDLMGGQIDFVFETLPALSSQMTSGKLKILAVTSGQRAGKLPQTPTMDEAGVKDFEVSTMYGLLAPRGTSPEILDKLSKSMRESGQQDAVRNELGKQGAQVKTSSPEETDKLIAGEVEKWGRVARSAKLE